MLNTGARHTWPVQPVTVEHQTNTSRTLPPPPCPPAAGFSCRARFAGGAERLRGGTWPCRCGVGAVGM